MATTLSPPERSDKLSLKRYSIGWDQNPRRLGRARVSLCSMAALSPPEQFTELDKLSLNWLGLKSQEVGRARASLRLMATLTTRTIRHVISEEVLVGTKSQEVGES